MNKLFVFVQGRPGIAGEELWARARAASSPSCAADRARATSAAPRRAPRSRERPRRAITVSEYDGMLELWFAGPGRMDATGVGPGVARTAGRDAGRHTITERTIVLAAQEVLQLDRGHGQGQGRRAGASQRALRDARRVGQLLARRPQPARARDPRGDAPLRALCPQLRTERRLRDRWREPPVRRDRRGVVRERRGLRGRASPSRNTSRGSRPTTPSSSTCPARTC